MVEIVRCPFCLAAGSCELAWSAKARPYLRCKQCLTRAFLNTLNALAGVAIVPPMLDDAIRQSEENPAYKRRLDARVKEVVDYVRNRGAEAPARSKGELPQRPTIVPYVVGVGTSGG